MADLAHAEQAQAARVEECTHSKCALAWRRWLEYLNTASLLSDPFLDAFQPLDMIHFLCAFMHTVCDGRFSCGPDLNKDSTAREAMDYVAQKFKAAFCPNPRTDLTSLVSILLKWQTKGYQHMDPSAQHEKALPCSSTATFFKLPPHNLTPASLTSALEPYSSPCTVGSTLK